jgi:hypothetical protein
VKKAKRALKKMLEEATVRPLPRSAAYCAHPLFPPVSAAVGGARAAGNHIKIQGVTRQCSAFRRLIYC